MVFGELLGSMKALVFALERQSDQSYNGGHETTNELFARG